MNTKVDSAVSFVSVLSFSNLEAKTDTMTEGVRGGVTLETGYSQF